MLRHLSRVLRRRTGAARARARARRRRARAVRRAVSAAVARRNIRRMARQFIAGADPRASGGRAASAVGAAARRSRSTCSARRRSPRPRPTTTRRVSTSCSTLLVTATRPGRRATTLERDPWGALPRVNVSVKPTALSPLLRSAHRAGGVGRGDGAARARSSTVPAATRRDGPPRHRARRGQGPRLRAAARASASEYPDVQLGCVVQAYRTDSFADLRDLVEWSARHARRPAADPAGEGRVLGRRDDRRRRRGLAVAGVRAKAETDANFERCARYLLDHAGRGPARVRQPQPPQPRLRDRRRRARASSARRRGRAPAALRHGRAAARRARAWRATGARVRAGRRARARAWRTSCAGCSRTRRTSASSGTASPRAATLDELVAPPAVDRRSPRRRADRDRSGSPTDRGAPGAVRQRAPRRAAPAPARGAARCRPSVTRSARLGFDASRAHRRRGSSRRDGEIVSVDPGDCDGRVPQRSRRRVRRRRARSTSPRRAWPAWRATPWRRPRRGAVPRRRDHARAPRASSPR